MLSTDITKIYLTLLYYYDYFTEGKGYKVEISKPVSINGTYFPDHPEHKFNLNNVKENITEVIHLFNKNLKPNNEGNPAQKKVITIDTLEYFFTLDKGNEHIRFRLVLYFNASNETDNNFKITTEIESADDSYETLPEFIRKQDFKPDKEYTISNNQLEKGDLFQLHFYPESFQS